MRPAHRCGARRDGPTRVWASGDLRPHSVALAVVRQTWPLQMLTGALLVVAAWWWLVSGDTTIVRGAAHLELCAAVGLAGAFALHEAAHVVALGRCAGVTHLVVTVTAWRFSLEPRGTITPGQMVVVALSGPGAAAVAGAVLWLVAPGVALHWWFLAHLGFLLPVFGDGRSLVLGLRCLRGAHSAVV